jgi:hypothetical protein
MMSQIQAFTINIPFHPLLQAINQNLAGRWWTGVSAAFSAEEEHRYTSAIKCTIVASVLAHNIH